MMIWWSGLALPPQVVMMKQWPRTRSTLRSVREMGGGEGGAYDRQSQYGIWLVNQSFHWLMMHVVGCGLLPSMTGAQGPCSGAGADLSGVFPPLHLR